MLFALALLGLAAPLVSAIPGAVTAAISPSTPAPSGCSYNYNGYFNFAKAENAPPSKQKRQDPNDDVVLTLKNGVMQDSDGYTGYVASNYQFQFDKPPQAGAIYTAGFSVCPNMTIALGDTAVWYQCSNGSGKLNIYYEHTTGLKCSQIFLEAIPKSEAAGSPAPAPAPAPVTPAPSSTPAAVATTLADGQPQVPSTYAPITSIVDHQPQVGTAIPAPPPVESPPPYTGAAYKAKAEMAAVAVGALAVAVL